MAVRAPLLRLARQLATKAKGSPKIDPKFAPFLDMLERPSRSKRQNKKEYAPEVLAENEERAKEYSRKKNLQHRAWLKDMRTKLQLKWDAVEALPERLKAQALVVDKSPFPTMRRLPTDTPPKDL